MNTFPDTVGSVRVVVDSTTWHDNTAPYTVDPAAPLMSNGTHLLVATPYSGSDGSGLGGVPLFVRVQVDSHWTRTGSLNTGRMNHAAILLDNGRVLAGPTYDAATTKLYNPGSGGWSFTGSAKHPRTHYTLTRLGDGKVLLVGGGVHQVKPTETELYDPAVGTWTVRGSLNQGRRSHTATLLKDGRVLVVGGYRPVDDGYATVEVSDPALQVWSTLPEILPVAQHTATLLGTGQVLVVGGNWNTPLAWLFNPATIGWTSITTPGYPFIAHTATLMPDGKVLVAGGRHSWLYAPDTGSWTRRGDLSVHRNGHTTTLLPNGRVLLKGGDLGEELLRDAELYDPATGAWTPTSPMIERRRGHTATLLPNGRVLVVGSDDYNAPKRACEMYTPTP